MPIHIVIIGGGTAGLSVLRNIHRKRSDLKITLIEPSETHYYQPLWTLVGGGIFPMSISARPLKDFIPQRVQWIQQKVAEILPDRNQVQLTDTSTVNYDYLIVTAGLQLDWSKVEGLPHALGTNGICSNYSVDHVEYTWKTSNSLRSGRALFTFPNTPIKCAGAPQKVMYLSEETFRKNGVREITEVKFISAGAAIFGIAKYREALEKVILNKKIKTQFSYNLVKVDPVQKIATFKKIDSDDLLHEKFDMLHVTPPMSAPDFLKKSPLANDAGWVDVDKHSTQHKRFPNVFSIGDCSSLPNSKTGAAIRRQGPVLVSHLFATIDKTKSTASYNGYASCPLVTSRSTCILAEFNYEGQPEETFPFNQAKERLSMFLLKKWVIPFMYWNAMLRGYF